MPLAVALILPSLISLKRKRDTPAIKNKQKLAKKLKKCKN
jgi:hypothetical protein